MSWPDDQAYNEAIQNPHLCFSDAELKAGTVAALPSGLPKVVSGNFASVYQIKCPKRTWAVRCFRKEITDQKIRYNAIGKHLRRIRLPYFVEFEFVPEGIRVGSQWYPIVKMEWITGQCLDEYVEAHLNRPDALIRLSREWYEMMCALEREQVAHGDLQNGNVLVVDGALKLIDYDGMYVPALANQPSPERGHPDFQHPARSQDDWGPHLDRFSAWIVFSSLLTLSVAPHLWKMLEAGGDKLLFNRKDFSDPQSSPALTALRLSGSEHLTRLANELTAGLRGSPREIRPLEALYVPPEQPRQDQGPPEWLREQVGAPVPARPGGAEVGTSSSEQRGTEWLIDHLVESSSLTPVSFAGRLLLERFYVLLMALTLVACAIAAMIGKMSPGFASASAISVLVLIPCLLVRRYRSLDIVRQRRACAASLKNARQQEHDARAAVEQVACKLASKEAEHRKRVSALHAQLNDIQKQQTADMEAVQRDAIAAITRLSNQRRTLVDQQVTKIRSAEARINSAMGSLTSELNSLGAAEQSERARVLQSIQSQHLKDFLRRQPLVRANISGIGPKLMGRLAAVGVATAADVSYPRVYRVCGIGPQRAKALVEWRESIEHRAHASMPQSLPPAEDHRIRAEFASRAQSLRSQIETHRQRLESEKRAIQGQYQAQLKQLDAEIASTRARADQQLSQVRAKYQSEEQRVHVELKKANEQHAAVRRAIEGERASLERTLFQAQFTVARQERELGRFRAITFAMYVARVAGLPDG